MTGRFLRRQILQERRESRQRRPRVRAGVTLAVLIPVFAALSVPGCAKQNEGERCDFTNSEHDDCESEFECVPADQLRGDVDRCCPSVGNKITDERCIRVTGSGGAGGTSGAAGAAGAAAGSAGEAGGGAGGTAGSDAGTNDASSECSVCRYNSDCATDLICGPGGCCQAECVNDRDCEPPRTCVVSRCQTPAPDSGGD
jgi:hypothetical protein